MSDEPDWSWLADFVQHEMDWGDANGLCQEKGEDGAGEWNKAMVSMQRKKANANFQSDSNLQGSLVSFLHEAPQHCIARPNSFDDSAITNPGTNLGYSPLCASQIDTASFIPASQPVLSDFSNTGNLSAWDFVFGQDLALPDEHVNLKSVSSRPDLTYGFHTNEAHDAREQGITMAASSQTQCGPSRVLRPKNSEPKGLQNSDGMSMGVDSGFDFTSGCKIVSSQSPIPTRHPKKRAQEKQYDTGIRCTFPNCSNKQDFRRRYELERHMLTHDAPRRFSCPVTGCDRHGQRGFPREDKFKAHMRNAHQDEDALCACPVPGCGIEQMELDLLRVHCSIHVSSVIPEVTPLRRYAEELRQCPMHKCTKKRWNDPSKTPGPSGHLMSHDEDERRLEQSSILSKGYDSLTGLVICPVCGYRSASTYEFTEHLEDEHVLSEDHRGFGAHIRSWKSKHPELEKTIEGYKRWAAWQSISYGAYGYIEFTCNYCSRHFSARAIDADYRSHVELLKSSQELLPYRRQILQLCPAFASHPVFDDVRRNTQN